ncbi:ATP-dependent Clp protease ATP-binding protein [Planomonospora sphaerica]|uniref:ATP-dependent Clp protease ATP-binding protein n=1 Tax=Planomonospora sphaerica TaxID=161355 RepID=A0A161LMK5_9ACTN|nr:ATP-dependent Clp protease ATP-binding protein [Planomonospora sphaerica]
MFERFTDRARRVVVLAQEEARRLSHDHIGTEHVLLGLLGEEDGVAARALQSFGIGLEQVRSDIEKIIGQGSAPPPGHVPFTPRAKKVLELSLREALDLRHTYIGTEHILLGLIREGEGLAAQVLTKRGARLEAVRAHVVAVLDGRGGDRRGRLVTAEEVLTGLGPSLGGKLDRIQESLDRIERRLDALGAPQAPDAPSASSAPRAPDGPAAARPAAEPPEAGAEEPEAGAAGREG